MTDIDRSTVQAKIDEYRSFLDQTLRPEMALAQSAKQVVDEEIQAYEDLQHRLPTLPSTLTVDLGWNKAYCEALIDSDSKIFVDVGMGFHVELTAEEAADFCAQRLQFLQRKLADRKEKLRKVEEHVSTAEDILDHLANEANSLP